MSLRQHMIVRRMVPKVKPSYRTSSSVGQTGGNTLTIPVPAAAQVGDLAFFVLSVLPSNTVTPPAGMTLVFSGAAQANATLHVYSATIGAGDAGSGKAFSLSTGNASVGICALYANVGGYSVVPNFYVSTSTESLNNRAPRFPSIWAGPDDVIVAIGAAGSVTSTNVNTTTASNAPAGLTARQALSRQQNALVVPRGACLFDGPAHGLQMETFAYPNSTYNIGLILALSPVAPRWVEIEKVPSSLAGKPAYIYGTSSPAYVKRMEINDGYNTRSPWGSRIINALGAHPASNNMCMPGSRAADICTFAWGTKSMPTQAVNGDPLCVTQSGTWASIANKDCLILTDLIGNDIIAQGPSAQAILGARTAVDATLRLLRSLAIFGHGSPSLTYTGTWTTQVSDGLSGGQARFTSTPGNKVVLTVNNTPSVDLVVIAGDNSSAGNTGADYTVAVDGIQVSAGATHNQMKATGWGANYGFCQKVIPITGIPAGTHTITLTHAGPAGGILMFNGFLIPNPTPPWIVTNCLGEMAADAYTSLGFTKETQDTYRQLLRDVAAGFPDGRVVVYDPSESGLWQPGAYLATDKVHQNEQGHCHYAHEILQRLVERVP